MDSSGCNKEVLTFKFFISKENKFMIMWTQKTISLKIKQCLHGWTLWRPIGRQRGWESWFINALTLKASLTSRKPSDWRHTGTAEKITFVRVVKSNWNFRENSRTERKKEEREALEIKWKRAALGHTKNMLSGVWGHCELWSGCTGRIGQSAWTLFGFGQASCSDKTAGGCGGF